MPGTNPIAETISAGDDTTPAPRGTQPAWSAVVHLLIPHTDRYGTAVTTPDQAMEYISETLRGEFLDWGYAINIEHATVFPVEVCEPYVEGSHTPGRTANCWRCGTEITEQVDIIALDSAGMNTCPEADELDMPHEIDEPE